jgi:hypothetical protein
MGFFQKYVKADYQHILGMELESTKRTIPQIGAFHHDSMNGLENSGIAKLSEKIMYQAGFYRAKLLFNEITIKHTVAFFPASWSRNQIMDAIFEVYEEFVQRVGHLNFHNSCLRRLRGVSKNNVELEIIIARNGTIITAYPILKLDYLWNF